MMQEEYKEQSRTTTSSIEKSLVKKRKRLPSQERLRHELVYQLRESLQISLGNVNREELTLAEREHWTRVHTYTAQVLNTILRDQQFREWERRLKELEEQGFVPDGIMTNSEP